MGRYDPEPEDVDSELPVHETHVQISKNAESFLRRNASRLRCVSSHVERDADGVAYSVCARAGRGGREDDEWILWVHAVEFGIDRESQLGGRLHADARRMQQAVADAAYAFLRSERDTPVPTRS